MSTATVPAWRRCDAVLRHRRRLSPTFLLLTLAGPDLRRVADNGADQRVKLAFGVPGHGLRAMPSGPVWYHRWRALRDAL
ncbi:MAG TPA: siderophore-interacting protein, partial [Pilimelia sp.]|nr:siderophore-interacting protein [Pilimelia sp.]